MHLDYEKIQKETLKHEYLYHYTSQKGLELICKNKSLLLNMIGNTTINDPEENARIVSLWHSKIYVACFTNTLDNEDYFWKNYAHNGARIKFKLAELNYSNLFYDSECSQPIPVIQATDFNYKKEFKAHERYSEKEDWGLYSSALLDIQYVDDLNEYNIDQFESNPGLLKSRYGKNNKGEERQWEIESETRIRAALRPLAFEHYINGINIVTPAPCIKSIFMDISNVNAEVTMYSELNKV